MNVRKIAALALALTLTLCAPALAFDPARFEGVAGVEVTYDSENPTDYSVRAGFRTGSDWAQFGGHLVVRYMNAGKSEELPLMLASFTTEGGGASQMTVRTSAHRYEVVCSDLSQAGMDNVDTEAPLLVSPASLAMFEDIAASGYARIEIVSADGESSFAFLVDDDTRRLLDLFLEEYHEEIVPMLAESATLVQVYAALAPQVTGETARDLTADVEAICAAEYPELTMDSTGDEVTRLQQALADLGYLDGGVDGIFGMNTAAAVKAFQTAVGLEADGVADAATQAELYLLVMNVDEVADAGDEGSDAEAAQ